MTYVLCDLSGPVQLTAQPYFRRTAQHSIEKHTHARQTDSKCSTDFYSSPCYLRSIALCGSLLGTDRQLNVIVIHIRTLQGLCCRKVSLGDMRMSYFRLPITYVQLYC